MPRRNHRPGRHRQAPRHDRAVHTRPSAPAPMGDLGDLVIPQGRCHQRHQKLQFTEIDAPRALKQSQEKRARTGTGHAEKRFYECKTAKGGCGFWHLTSRETWEQR